MKINEVRVKSKDMLGALMCHVEITSWKVHRYDFYELRSIGKRTSVFSERVNFLIRFNV